MFISTRKTDRKSYIRIDSTSHFNTFGVERRFVMSEQIFQQLNKRGIFIILWLRMENKCATIIPSERNRGVVLIMHQHRRKIAKHTFLNKKLHRTLPYVVYLIFFSCPISNLFNFNEIGLHYFQPATGQSFFSMSWAAYIHRPVCCRQCVCVCLLSRKLWTHATRLTLAWKEIAHQ